MRERAAIHLAVMGAGDLWTLSSDGAVGFSLTRSEYSIRGVIVIGLLVIRAGHARSNSEGDVQNVEISWWGPWGTERGSNLWGARALLQDTTFMAGRRVVNCTISTRQFIEAHSTIVWGMLLVASSLRKD
jgi:hypothetical protein